MDSISYKNDDVYKKFEWMNNEKKKKGNPLVYFFLVS